MTRYVFLVGLVALVGCKWTAFDDLAGQTWAHSTQSPNVGSTDYALAVSGTTTDATGGRLSVISNDTPTHSTLEYDAKGNVSLGANPERLAGHNIASLGEQPIFTTDGAGHFAVVAASTTPNFIAVHSGDAAAPGDTSIMSASPPDAATYLGTSLVIAAGTNLFVLDANGARWCVASDETSSPLAAVALGADDTNVWAWTATGTLLSYDKAALQTCAMLTPASTMGTAIAANAMSLPTGFVPGVGAIVQVLGTSTSAKEYLVLAAHANQATNGQVMVVDAATLTKTDTLPADGLESAVLAQLGASARPFVVLGFPSRSVNGTISGQVELHALDATTGKLAATADETLSDDQPDASEQFGRAVGVMKFNGTGILAVAAKNEVFTYFRTQSYPETRQPPP
ncbi:MAG: hypothetical protein ACM31C_13110 [Acidobacteriota bacterium]